MSHDEAAIDFHPDRCSCTHGNSYSEPDSGADTTIGLTDKCTGGDIGADDVAHHATYHEPNNVADGSADPHPNDVAYRRAERDPDINPDSSPHALRRLLGDN